ncbi:MAG: amidohydrolase [Anaerolineae bacterium]|nr:amidohydrolase [Anaerolineae bacterium]
MIDFLTETEAMRDQLVAWRRDFHMHPELKYEERRTAAIVAAHLEALGYCVQTGVARTGVVGLLEGAAPGPVVMLRFDMDALPVTEETGAPYASRTPGCMHACGHDGHVAIGMGLAQLLAGLRLDIAGSVKLIFQPAEEGGNGAALMVQEGVLEAPRPDVFLSAHIWTDAPVGTVNVTPGPVMAAADTFTCTVRGRGGHGALPHQSVDPVVAAAHVVTALQTIVSRNVSPLDTAVVTVGAIHGGDAFNVIPPTVELRGTIRTYQPHTRTMIHRRMQETVDGVAAGCGAAADLEIVPLTPAVINDPEVTQVVMRAAESILGADRVHSGERTMGSEDAAFFLNEIPGCYFFLGGANPEKHLGAPHHNPRFDFDEDVLPLGVRVLARASATYLMQSD